MRVEVKSFFNFFRNYFFSSFLIYNIIISYNGEDCKSFFNFLNIFFSFPFSFTIIIISQSGANCNPFFKIWSKSFWITIRWSDLSVAARAIPLPVPWSWKLLPFGGQWELLKFHGHQEGAGNFMKKFFKKTCVDPATYYIIII